MKKLLALAIVAASTCAPAFAAPARDVNLMRAFAAQLPKVKRATTVPILLPGSLPLGGSYKVYATGGGSRAHWKLSLAGAPNCGGANACFVASFEGQRGGTLPGRANVRLTRGGSALYRPFSCGGSCSPTSFWFVHAGVLYSWQVKDLPARPKALLTRLANEAIAAGPR
jgi:hypothetical protein